jgi:hypothetical protein
MIRVVDEDVDATGHHSARCAFDLRELTLRCPPVIGDLSGDSLFCTRAECLSRLVLFRGHLAESGGREGERISVSLSIDVDVGYVLIDADVGDEPGQGCLRTKPRVEQAAAWLGESLSTTILDMMHRRLIEAKGKTLDPDAWKKRDWSWWAPGAVVAWQEVEPDGRADLYVARERCYSAIDYYCANPTCDCAEVKVVFLAPQDAVAERRKLGTVTFSLADARPPSISELGPGVAEDQLAELGSLFVRRHGGDGLAKRLRRVRHDVGVEIHRRYVSGSHAPPTASGIPKVGPNARCPCGSGKKFKKCCRSLGR